MSIQVITERWNYQGESHRRSSGSNSISSKKIFWIENMIQENKLVHERERHKVT